MKSIWQEKFENFGRVTNLKFHFKEAYIEFDEDTYDVFFMIIN